MTLCNKQNTHTECLSLCLALSALNSFHISRYRMTPLYTNFKVQRTQTKYIERLAKLNKYCEGC